MNEESNHFFTLIVLYVCLLPFFIWNAIKRFAILHIPVGANPSIPLGGLPLTPKDIRQGSSHLYTETKREIDMSLSSFPLIVKPLFGSRSRNVVLLEGKSAISRFEEPMIYQPYIPGKEFAINVLRKGENVDVYGVTEIEIEEAIWSGQGTYKNRTSSVQSKKFLEAVRSACDEVGLFFGRLDVRAESLRALRRGEFKIVEVNGSLAVDLRLYTDAGFTQKYWWAWEHWSKLLQAYDVSKKAVYPRFLWFYILYFLYDPVSARGSWEKIKHEYFTSCS